MREEVGIKPSPAGLNRRQVEKSRQRYGKNVLQPPKRKSLLIKILVGFSDPIIRILIGALLLNFLFLFKTFNLYETAGILIAILLATVISAISERGGELAFEKMIEESTRAHCTVRRDGRTNRIPSSEVVVGDAVYLEAGQKIPADGLLVKGEVSVDQSSLNGETREVFKRASTVISRDPSPSDAGSLFAGTSVLYGEGILFVTAVGEQTVFGSMSRDMKRKTGKTPLKSRLEKLAGQMSTVGYVSALLAALSHLVCVFFVANDWNLSLAVSKISDFSVLLPELIQALMLGVSVIVMAVPEGLPMMISVVLSSNVKRMRRDSVLVRKSEGIETAGSLNLLFTDKTGTLTRGKPVVSGVVTAFSFEPATVKSIRKLEGFYRYYEQSARYNTQSRVFHGRAVGGNATDRSILQSVLPLWDGEELQVTEKIPFDSVMKTSSCRVGSVLLRKGSPETLLRNVNACIDRDGSIRPYINTEQITAAVKKYTSLGIRVLALTVETDGVVAFHSLILLRDELRREAPEAVRRLQGAGIAVVMITGDNPDTARSIAQEAGLITNERNLVLTGAQLAAMNDEELNTVLPRICVVARALPTDKIRLVALAKKSGLTVGMTGDGINDAPALKSADVGFAMGSGTEVAKEAGDIVILDDNIKSICSAVLYGRTIFKSIRKFILFQMTTNLVAVAISVVCPLIGIQSPITVLQMLWINMIMDTFGSLAFAGEPPLERYMNEAPKKRDEPILNVYMVLRVLLVGGYLLAVLLWFLCSAAVRHAYGYRQNVLIWQSAFFALFVFCDLCNSFGARTTSVNPFRDMMKNKSFLFIFGCIIIIQFGLLYFGGYVFRTVPLPPHLLLPVLLISCSVLPVNAFVKWFLRKILHGKGV